jgi:anaerobic selenocysteine-containing dehydrogenase
MGEIRHSICVLDCPDACSLEVEVEDGRLLRIDGGHANPLTGGYICGKVRSQMADHLYGDARLLQPLARRGVKGAGEFEPIAWDVALDRIAERLTDVRDEFGGEAILPLSYGGSNGFLTQDNADARLFRRLGASRLARTVCAAPTTAAATGLYGKMPGIALPDYAHAAGIVLWGVNPAVSGIHLMPVVQEAQARGAWLVVIDPRRTRAARIADLHLAVRPGTDLPVALSIINWLFESGNADDDFLGAHAIGVEALARRASPWDFAAAADVAGVDARDIAELAERYVAADPAALRCGWGLERNRNGGSAAAAVLALPAVAGKFGVRAGGYTMSNTGAWQLDATRAAAADAVATRVINMNRVGEALLRATPPVRALFVYNCNPLVTLPCQDKVRRGFERDDLFTVVFDQVMTDTARYADIVLPATTFLEHGELGRGYGAYVLHRSKAVVDRVGEARSNCEVFAELCERAGLARVDDPRGEDGIAEAILDAAYPGVGATLDAGGAVRPEFGDAPVQFVDVFPRTADGKIHLVPEELDAEARERGGLYHYVADRATSEHPLALISPASKHTVSSTFGQLRTGIVPVELHPQDAAARGIDEGAAVRVFNELGAVRCAATINPSLRQGVACIPKGTWTHNTRSGNTANVLVPDTLTDVGGGACFNDARVEVAREE